MERLKDTHFELASLEAEASALLSGAEPYHVPSALKRNVRVRLVEAAPRRRVPLLLRVAIAAGVLGVVVAAFAAAGHFTQKPRSLVSPVGTNQASGVGVGAVGSGAPLGLAGNAPSPSQSALPTPSSSASPSALKRTAGDAHPDAHRDSLRDPASVSEASLVYDSARALRNEGDPARASRVLDEYFKRYPHGALGEEAQALAIDIAVARGDSRAKTLATRYLSAYPNGHFRAKAERVLAAQ